MPTHRLPRNYDEPQAYTVHVALNSGEIVPAARLRLLTDRRGRHRQSGIRYLDTWQEHPGAFALNPVHAPLVTPHHEWVGVHHTPAIIDEVLPGRWEQAVIARKWQEERQGRDVRDLHAVLHEPHGTLRVGAVTIAPASWDPSHVGSLRSSLHLADLKPMAEEAVRLEEHETLELETLKRFQAGTAVGGARPKLLVSDGPEDFIVKFNRRDDRFNHARVEHACLELARRAGLSASQSEVAAAGPIEALKIRRFDTTPSGGRRHLVSANALLKDPRSQADSAQPRYDDLVGVIARHSDQPTEDLKQLYGQMLLNVAINNHDDHLRNFSFLRGERGFGLSPAYDLIVTDETGGFPVLSVGYETTLPRPGTRKAIEVAKVFRLKPSEARQIDEGIVSALEQLDEVLDEAGVDDRDRRMMRRICGSP